MKQIELATYEPEPFTYYDEIEPQVLSECSSRFAFIERPFTIIRRTGSDGSVTRTKIYDSIL